MEHTNTSNIRPLADALIGCLLGTALGDAIGLPAEGLPRRRLERLFGKIEGHRFLFRRGMVSDDTEHAILVAQALIATGGDAKAFPGALARQMRGWFCLLPAAVGLATLRACLRLLVGVPPERSGVYSAGNGPAMRAAILGVCAGDDPVRLRALVGVSSRMTHTDPRAEYGALAVAVAADAARSGTLDAATFAARLRALLPDNNSADEVFSGVDAACRSAAAGATTSEFAQSFGLSEKVSGYICHTVPVALHAALRHPTDLRAAVIGAVACGGDTDSVAAIVGGIVGAGVGAAGIPADWEVGLMEWPRNVGWMRTLALRLAAVTTTGRAQPTLKVSVPGLLVRNLLFLAVVLAHGFRRLLPPY